MSKLKDLRLAKGLSQSQLSAQSNVSIRTIQNYEQGRTINNAPAGLLQKIAIALDVKIEDLLEPQNKVDE